jgi:hypothetical protein
VEIEQTSCGSKQAAATHWVLASRPKTSYVASSSLTISFCQQSTEKKRNRNRQIWDGKHLKKYVVPKVQGPYAHPAFLAAIKNKLKLATKTPVGKESY